MRVFSDFDFVGMEIQSQCLFQEIVYWTNEIFEVCFIMRHDDEIVGVPRVMFDFKRMLHKLIKYIHINIGEQLGCQISNGYAFLLARSAKLSLSLSH
jgi:hypothetical protein